MNFLKKIIVGAAAAALLASATVTAHAEGSLIDYKITYKTASTTLTFTKADEDNEIRYTTDGTAPTEDSALYTESIRVKSATTIRAAEFNEDGEKVRSFKTTLKRKCRKVVLSAEKYGDGFIAALESPTDDCLIYYTTDGSKPTVKSTPYNGAFFVEKGTVVRALAVKDGWKNSASSKFTVTEAVGALPEGTEFSENGSDELVSSVLELVNAYRAENGLSSLTLDSSLCAAAELRASEIAEDYSIAHSRPDGREWYTVFEEVGFVYCFAGENLAYTQGWKNTADFVMNSWMDSAPHRRNILNEHGSLIGIAYVKKSDYIYWVQLFGERM